MRRAMIAEHPMRQSAVPDEFERTVEVRLKFLGRNLRVGMIAHLAVYARNRLYVLKNRSDVVAHKHDGAILVYLFQKTVENALEMLVDISVRFVEKNHIGWNGEKFNLSEESDEWWLTELVSDCWEEEYEAVSSIEHAHSYLEGSDAPSRPIRLLVLDNSRMSQ